jgi:hypothetical protein
MLSTLVREYSSTMISPFWPVFDACGLETQTVGVGIAAQRQHDLIGDQRLAVEVCATQAAIGAALDLLEDLVAQDADALFLHRRMQAAAHVHVEPRQDLLAAVDQRGVNAQTHGRCWRIRPRCSRRRQSGWPWATRRGETPRWSDAKLVARQRRVRIGLAAHGDQDVTALTSCPVALISTNSGRSVRRARR